MTTPTLGDVIAQGQELIDTIKNGALAVMQADFAGLKSALIKAISDANAAIPTAVATETYKTLYVDNDGDDVLGDGSKSNPFNTVQKAVDTLGVAIKGNIVLTGGQTFTETVRCSARACADITFSSSTAAEKPTLIIDCGSTFIPCSRSELMFKKVNLVLVASTYLTGWHYQYNPASATHSKIMMSDGSLTHDEGLISTSAGATADEIELIWNGMSLTSSEPNAIMPKLASNQSGMVIVAAFRNVTRTLPAGKVWRDYMNVVLSGDKNYIGTVSLDV